MASNIPVELVDLRSNGWGNVFPSAAARFLHSDEIIQLLMNMAFPTFDDKTWTPARTYKASTFVHDENGASWVSLKKVPSGILLSDPNYWTRWESKDALVQFLDSEIKRLDEEKAGKVDLASPFNFKGTLTSLDKLPSSNNEINDTYYISDLKYRVSWNGSGWYQSSMEESGYLDELNALSERITQLSDKFDEIINDRIATVEEMMEYLGLE